MPLFDPAEHIGFDFETSGALPEYALQPWRVQQRRAFCTSLVWIHRRTVRGGLEPTVADMEAMLDYAIEHNLTIVGWHVVFDIMWLIAHGLRDKVFKVRWLDGMLLWRHAFIEPEYDETGRNRKSYGLKTCVAELMPAHANYADDVDFHDPSPAARAVLHEYNIRDVIFTLRCTKHWYEQLTSQQLKAALIEAECLPMVADANLRGMEIDTLAARWLAAKLDDTAATLHMKLSMAGVEDVEKVVRSPTKLGKLLFDVWKLPVLKENTGKKTGKVSRATDKEVLHELAFLDPRAKDVREYREALNNKTKFAVAPVVAAEYNEDDRAHPMAIVFGTYSGRLTYASKQGRNKDERPIGFALHQEKRDPIFRDIVVAPEGYSIVEFDASGQEYRWMAEASGDEIMRSLCMPGEDPHSFMGARIEGLDYRWLIEQIALAEEGKEADPRAKPARQLGKVGNLSLQYRTSARKVRVVARVQYNIPMEMPQADLIHRTYQRTYRGVPIYWDKQIAQTKRLGYVETFAGRRVRVVGNWSGPNGWSMGSTAINYRIQGTGADQKYLAMMVMKPYLTEIGGHFAWDLHDGIYLYIPDRHVARAAKYIKSLLDNLPYQRAWGYTPSIPMPWDCKVGKSWGSLKKYEPH